MIKWEPPTGRICDDYRRVIQTKALLLIMRVHQSNYRIVGLPLRLHFRASCIGPMKRNLFFGMRIGPAADGS